MKGGLAVAISITVQPRDQISAYKSKRWSTVIYVTVYGKTGIWVSVKIELDLFDNLYPTSNSQVKFEAIRVLRFGDSILCSQSRYTHRNQEIMVHCYTHVHV